MGTLVCEVEAWMRRRVSWSRSTSATKAASPLAAMLRRVRGMCLVFNATCALLSGLFVVSAAMYSYDGEVDCALSCIARRVQPYTRECYPLRWSGLQLTNNRTPTASLSLCLACPVGTRREKCTTMKKMCLTWSATSSPSYPTRGDDSQCASSFIVKIILRRGS